MKRGTPDHPKVYELAEALGVSWPTAIGHLELLFHFTAQYCPQGNIGKYSPKRIAAALGWNKRPQVLIDGMVKSGWVEPHPIHTLIVHDWHLHLDRTTAQRVSRLGLSVVQPIHADTANVCTQSETQKRTLPPTPTPTPTEPEPHFDTDLSDIARSIWQRHPKHRRGTIHEAERSLVAVVATAVDPGALAAAIDQRHSGWCASEEWREQSGRFAPGLSRWLEQGGCMREPPEEGEDWAADLIRREAEGRA